MLVAALVSSLLASSLATARPDKHEHSGHAAQHNEVDTGEKMLWRIGGLNKVSQTTDTMKVKIMPQQAFLPSACVTSMFSEKALTSSPSFC